MAGPASKSEMPMLPSSGERRKRLSICPIEIGRICPQLHDFVPRYSEWSPFQEETEGGRVLGATSAPVGIAFCYPMESNRACIAPHLAVSGASNRLQRKSPRIPSKLVSSAPSLLRAYDTLSDESVQDLLHEGVLSSCRASQFLGGDPFLRKQAASSSRANRLARNMSMATAYLIG